MKNFTTAESIYKDFDQFYNQLIDQHCLELELEVESSVCNTEPELVIEFNSEIVYRNCLPAGNNRITLTLNQTNINCLRLSMLNKGPNDVQVVNDKIVADKFILFKELNINKYEIFGDPDLYYSNLTYTQNNQTVDVKPGFWHNSTLEIAWNGSFINWIQEHSKRNTQLSESISSRKKDDNILNDIESSIVGYLNQLIV